MIPRINDDLKPDFIYQALPTCTYRLINNRLIGFVDEKEALEQAIYFILSTERYQHLIYSWDYGIELSGLYGKPKDYVIIELTRRITEALIQDDRIHSLDGFYFDTDKDKITATFTVHTKYGDIQAKKAVVI